MIPVRARACLELGFACTLWGFGFVAAVWALRGGFGPNQVTAMRLTIGGGGSAIVIALIPGLRRSVSREQIWLAFLPGVWLSLTLVLQTWGLKYTTATKSGFVTTLYVLAVPVLERTLLKKRLPHGHLSAVAVACFGTALICDFHGGGWNIGDLLTLGCAIAASFQIVWFGLLRDRTGDAFVFNALQALWAAPLPLALAFAFEDWPKQAPTALAWAGVASLTLGSTVIAFSLQVRAQKKLRPSTASLIFLMESPFAAIFAMVLLGETLTRSQWFGALLILATIIGSMARAARSSAQGTSGV